MVLNKWYYVHDTCFMVGNTWYMVHDTWFLALVAKDWFDIAIYLKMYFELAASPGAFNQTS